MSHSNSLVECSFAAGTLTYPLGEPSPLELDFLLPLVRLTSNMWIPFTGSGADAKFLIAHMDSCLEKPFSVQDLLFLIFNEYILATCKVLQVARTNGSYGTCVILRVYIVPHDLAGMQGRLRRRSAQKVIKPAMKILPTLLDKVCRLKDIWQGESMASVGQSKQIIPTSESEV